MMTDSATCGVSEPETIPTQGVEENVTEANPRRLRKWDGGDVLA